LQALRDVLRGLGLQSIDGSFLEGLFRGVVEPDEVPDRVVTYVLRFGRGGDIRIGKKISYAKHHTVDEALVRYYYDLALFYARRGDMKLSGVALGRAIHYAQDGAVKTRKLMVLDVHEDVEKRISEAIKSLGQEVFKLCRGVELGKKSSSNALEALCIAYSRTLNILRNFFTELMQRPDIERLRRGVWMWRAGKALAMVAAVMAPLVLGSVEALAITLPTAIGLALYTPQTYYQAMRAGIMITKPRGYHTAY
jgi:hypothetical protein